MRKYPRLWQAYQSAWTAYLANTGDELLRVRATNAYVEWCQDFAPERAGLTASLRMRFGGQRSTERYR